MRGSKASCEQHDRHILTCRGCEAAEHEAAFPPELLKAWEERAREMAPDWTAHMLPVFGGEPLFLLKRSFDAPGVSGRFTLTGQSQDALLDAANGYTVSA